MSPQQKDALKDIFRNAPLDIGGDPIEQRTNFEKMLSAQPLADDVTATPGELGGVPVLNIETGESSHDAVMLWFSRRLVRDRFAQDIRGIEQRP
jgi:monoterpene epsilon-lactone hydrolase